MAVRCLVSKRALNSFIDMVRSTCIVVFMKVNEFINNGIQRQKYKLVKYSAFASLPCRLSLKCKPLLPAYRKPGVARPQQHTQR